MELREEILLRKYEAALKAAEDCRKREVSLINYSIIIYGASIWAILTTGSCIIIPIVKLVVLVFLCILMGIIGLYIAKLNVVELRHFEMEKRVYIDAGISLEDYKNWPYPGLNKTLIWLVYSLIVYFTFVISIFVINSDIIAQAIIFIRLLIIYFFLVFSMFAINAEVLSMMRIFVSHWEVKYCIGFSVFFAFYSYYFYALIHFLDKKGE